jgi:glutamate decarboxylase
MEGYRAVHQMSQNIATTLSEEIGKNPAFEIITKGDELPVFCWRQTPGYTTKWDLQDLSDRLRYHGWQVPSYPMPDSIADVWVMRIVVRFGLIPSTAELLLKDIEEAVTYLDSLTGPMPREGRTGKATNFTYS